MSKPVSYRFIQDLLPSPQPKSNSSSPIWSSNLISAEEGDSIFFDVIKHYDKKRLSTVYDPNGDAINKVDLSARHVHWYDRILVPSVEPILVKYTSAVIAGIKEIWGLDVESLDLPQILGYEERCVFTTHADNAILIDGKWVCNDPDRSFTGILYISGYSKTATKPNTFCGGVLQFQNIQLNENLLKVYPEKGLALAFPSGPNFMHQVTPITRGYRIAIVNWWKVK